MRDIMKKVGLMVFDLDGTLIDSGDDLATAVNHALKEMSLPPLDRDVITGFVGDGGRKLIERSLGDGHNGRLAEAYNRFMSYYKEHSLDRTCLYPGVTDVLRHFGDTIKVIVTNKQEGLSRTIARALGIDMEFADIIGRDSTPFKKPDPSLMVMLAERYKRDIKETVVVGDGWNDIKLAKNAGAISCTLLNGLGPRERLLELHPDYCCEDITELKELFC